MVVVVGKTNTKKDNLSLAHPVNEECLRLPGERISVASGLGDAYACVYVLKSRWTIGQPAMWCLDGVRKLCKRGGLETAS